MEIVMFTDIRQMPFKRYIEFQKHLLIDSGIGSTMEDVSSHFQKLFSYLNHEKIPEAVTESQNLYRNIYAVLNGHNTSLTTICCLVKSLGGKYVNDISDEGLKKTAAILIDKGITLKEIETQLEEVKKN